MLAMFTDLQRLDANPMPDSEFVSHLVVLMPKDGDWRYLSPQLYNQHITASAAKRSLTSAYILEQIHSEEIHQGLGDGLSSLGSTLMLVRADFEC